MPKAVYILRPKPGESRRCFVERILDEAPRRLEACTPRTLKISVTTVSPPLLRVIPFRRDPVAAVSVGGDELTWNNAIGGIEGLAGGYRVDEAVPVAWSRNRPPGGPSPGAGLLTLFRKRPDIDYPTFIHRWHDGHTPLSLRVHPLCCYVRNVVKGTLCDGGRWYDGIVEEHTPTRAELVNPLRFFGGPLGVVWRMLEVYRDVRGFIDYGSIETYLVSEYRFRDDEL